MEQLSYIPRAETNTILTFVPSELMKLRSQWEEQLEKESLCAKLDSHIVSQHIPYLEWRHATRIHHVVQVLVDSVEEPKQELLGIVLGIPAVLHRVLGHDVLRREETVQQQLMQPPGHPIHLPLPHST